MDNINGNVNNMDELYKLKGAQLILRSIQYCERSNISWQDLIETDTIYKDYLYKNANDKDAEKVWNFILGKTKVL